MGTDKRARQKAGRQARLEEVRVAADRERRRRGLIRAGVLAVVVVGIVLLIWYLGRNDDGEQQASPTTTAPSRFVSTPYGPEDYGTGACEPGDDVETPVLFFEEPPQLCIDPAERYTAVFDTTAGEIRVVLDTDLTPGTTNSFVTLARFGYYDGSLIHRTDPSFGIIQGGAPNTNSAADPGPGYNVLDEGTGFTYTPGQLVMARTSAPNSGGGQFFFTVTDAVSVLDQQGTYVVFGEVESGLDVLEAVLASNVDDPNSGLGGAPDPPVVVNSVTIETDGA